jgi:hypothetical protein
MNILPAEAGAEAIIASDRTPSSTALIVHSAICRIPQRALLLGFLCWVVVIAGTGCQTTVESYTPPIPVDPHRSLFEPETKTTAERNV